jgi:RNA polymerase sigma-54 factor
MSQGLAGIVPKVYPFESLRQFRHGACVAGTSPAPEPDRTGAGLAIVQGEEMGSMQMRADTRQSQTLSPRLQRAVQSLQMSSLDFAALVRSKMEENPFLQMDEEDDAPAGPPGGLKDGSQPQAAESAAGPEVRCEPGDDRDMWLADRERSGRQQVGGDMGAMELAASDTTLAMHLHGQLNVMPLSERDLCMAHTIAESLDDDGYLRTPLEELAALRAPPTKAMSCGVVVQAIQVAA